MPSDTATCVCGRSCPSVQCLMCTGWQHSEKSVTSPKLPNVSRETVTILHRLHFTSTLKRMATLVKVCVYVAVALTFCAKSCKAVLFAGFWRLCSCMPCWNPVRNPAPFHFSDSLPKPAVCAASLLTSAAFCALRDVKRSGFF